MWCAYVCICEYEGQRLTVDIKCRLNHFPPFLLGQVSQLNLKLDDQLIHPASLLWVYIIYIHMLVYAYRS